MSTGWIGVDLDCTLAEFHGWNGGIGAPIPLMVDRVRQWLEDGEDVRIFTARVAVAPNLYSNESKRFADAVFATQQAALIEDWCIKHIGKVLPITATKDFMCKEIWDDRAHRVEPNTGREL